jgi:tetratricopeptide (TPR) repeat protein
MDLFRLQGKDKEFESASKTADSAYIGNPSIAAAYYEKGIDLFNKSQYINARKYFARTRTVKTPVYDNSDRMFNLINQWEQKSTNALPLFKRAKELNNLGDSLSSYMCQNLFELGRVHDQFGNLDSALYYYVNAAKYTPLKDTNSARYLYVYAKAVENDEPELADSLYELIVDRYPVTEFGVVARHIKGYTDNYVIDTVAELYKSGSSLRVNKEYRFAISQFLKIYDKYPTSVYAPRALYSIGWTFERDLKIQDTALIYYQLLMTKYPKSEYAKDISPSVMYLIAVKDGRVPKDTGNVQQAKINKGEAIKNDTTKLLMDKNKINQKPLEANKPGSVNTRQLDAKSVISNPNEVLKNLQDKAKDPNSYIPDIKINNPFGGWNKLKDTTTVKPDTTKIK